MTSALPDVCMLGNATNVVIRALNARGLSLPSERFAEAITRAYQMLASGMPVDKVYLEYVSVIDQNKKEESRDAALKARINAFGDTLASVASFIWWFLRPAMIGLALVGSLLLWGLSDLQNVAVKPSMLQEIEQGCRKLWLIFTPLAFLIQFLITGGPKSPWRGKSGDSK